MKRLDSFLESTGAEFLVVGELLIEGIEAYKAYMRHPGYDITEWGSGFDILTVFHKTR